MARKRKSIFFDLYDQCYGFPGCNNYYGHIKDNVTIIQRLNLIKRIKSHHGCVNSICWNDTGEYILSGSDDQHLCIVNGFTYKVLADINSSHRSNIFCAKFLPNTSDKKIISCSGDGTILFTDIENQAETQFNTFHCHAGTAYELMTIPNDPFCFVSCGEDGTVRWFDLRAKQKCCKNSCKDDILIYSHRAVTSISIDPVSPYKLAVGSADGIVRMFDRRLLGTSTTGNFRGKGFNAMFSRITVPTFEGKSHRITSLAHSRNGEEILVSYCSDHIYLFNVKDDQEGKKMLSTYISEGSESPPKKLKPVSVPPLKRLRLRGDWSDTGPQARPESENTNEVAAAAPVRGGVQYALMQRMSDVVTSILNDRVVAMANRDGSEESSSNESEEVVNEVVANEGDHASVPTVTVHLREVDIAQYDDSPSPSAPSSVNYDEPPPPAGLIAEPFEVIMPAVIPGGDGEVPRVTSEGHDQDVESNGAPDQTDPLAALHDLSLNISMDITRSDYESPTESHPQAGASSVVSKVPAHPSDSVCSPHNCPRLPFDSPSLYESSPRQDELDGQISSQSEKKQSVEEEISKESAPEESRPSSSNTIDNSGQTQPSNSEETPNSAVDSSQMANESQTSPFSVNILRNGGLARCINPALRGNSSQISDSDERANDSMDIDTSSDEEEDFLFSMMRRRADRVQLGEINIEEPLEVCHPSIKKQYTGHRNARTMIKEAVFWGDDYVMSGSDCGHVFVWDKNTAKVVMLMEADHHVVNCVQPHPHYPILASSGIDYDVKIWAPTLPESAFDQEFTDTIIHRNKVMLEETRDTITVPASFMIRMIASLNQLRRALGRRRNRME